MKNHILIICILFFGINLTSAQDLEWAYSINNGDNTTMSSFGRLVTKIDSQGNTYTVGFFVETTDFDPGPGVFNVTSSGLSDIYVMKLDSNGGLVWVKTIGNIDSSDIAKSIALDSNNNVYTIGNFNGVIDFDPGPNNFELSSTNGVIFIQKLDADGNFIWAKNFATGTGGDISISPSGDVYTIGSFEGTSDFDPGAGSTQLTSNGLFDVFIQKLDTNGNFIWAKSNGGPSGDLADNIVINNDGTIYSLGRFGDTVDFDPNAGISNLTSNGSGDIYVQKLDADGNFLWAKGFGGPDFDKARGFETDASGNVFTIGNFTGTIDFNPDGGTTNLTSVGSEDIFIQKLNSNGDFDWAHRIGGSGFDEGIDVKVDTSGDLYCAGGFVDTVDFDPSGGSFNLIAGASVNSYILKLNTDGNFEFAIGIGDAADNGIFNIAIAPNGEIYASGIFIGTGDFDPGSGVTNLTAIDSGGDLFFLKLSSTLGIDSNIIGVNAKVFPNPTSGNLTIDFDKSYSEISTIITNVLGQIIASEMSENTDTLELQIDSEPGIYFVNVTTSARLSETIKIIKN